MSPVTALLASTAVPPAPSPSQAPARQHARHYSVGFFPSLSGGGRAALAVECSSRPQKKGTQYPPLPPHWTLVASGATVDVKEAAAATPDLEVAAPAAAD
ncbi:uncharacterized protein [Miscanthus floridulus]|uniref:uncharacterized protein n=1 Tax=Miscanthus floridulus TaxID=154761 RepID=UPI00345B228F